MKIFYKNDYRPELWLGDRLLYSTLLEDDLRSEFNITTKVADRKVKLYTDTNKVLDKYIDNLKNHYSGKYYLTDWGDGTKDNLTEHTYAEPGSYTIKTHYVDAYPEVNSYATTILLKINYSIFKKISFVSSILSGYALTQYTSLEGAKVTVDDTTSFFNVEKGLKYFPNIYPHGVASVDFENVKTNNMTSLSRAFSFGWFDVEYITGMSSWDTSNVEDMIWMFYGCNSLKSLDLSSWDTSNVKYMDNMFAECTALKSLDLSSWDVRNVYNMENMFYNCSSLESLNLSTWVFKKGYGAKNMFYNLKYLIDWHYDGTNYANWNMSETYTGFGYVFPWNNKYTSFEYRIDPVNPDEYINSETYLPSLQTTDYDDYAFSGFDILIKKLDGNVYTYNYIDNVQAKDVDSIIVTLSSEYTFRKLRFDNYPSNYIKEFITIPDLSHDVFNINNFYSMFGHCTSLVSLDLSSWDVSNVTDMSNMFYKCSSLESLNVSGWNTSNVTNMNYMFDWCKSLTSLDLSTWNTSKVTNMAHMFEGCSSLNILNLSNFDTSKVTENENMLEYVPANVDWQYDGSGYSKFTLLESDTNFSGVFPWITYKNSLMYTISAEDDTHTLNGNYANYYLPIIHVDTGSGNLITVIKTGVTILKKDGTSVNDITGVLAKDVEQIIIDFTNLKDYTFLGMPYRVTEVQKMIGMEFLPNLHSLFFDCSLLKSLDLSSWNVSNVPEMSWMFYKCTSLESLNLSTWDTRKVTNPSAMFYQVPEDVDWHYERGNYTNFTLTESETSFSGEFPWNLDKIITRFTFNSSEDTMPTFNKSFTSYEVSDIDNEDGTTTRTIVRTSDELPTQIRFKDKTGLISVKILDTSNVTNMQNMFYGCSSLTSLDLSSWDTSNVTDMRSMFYGCSSLTTIDVSGWNTSNVTKMSDMFYGCSSLTSLDLSSWDVSNVEKLTSLFYECNMIDSLDLSTWNTSNVTDMSDMFYGCKSLTSLNLSTWNTSKVTNMSWMFYGCNALKSLDISSWNTSNVTNMNYMFCGCKSLTSLDLSNFDTSNVTDMTSIIQRCSSLTSIDLSNFDTSNVTLMSGVFDSCSSLTSLDLSSWNTINVTDMSKAFYGCTALTSLNLSTWNTSKVTSMSNMFYRCSSLTSLDLSNFNTSNVTSMNSIFSSCSSLTSIDLSSFDTSKVTSMSNMFSDCKLLTSLDLSNFNTSNVTKMINMFSSCSSLTTVDLSNFDTSKVTNMSRMFSSCSSLTSIDLSNFDTSNVTDMTSMFNWNTALTSLNLSTWNTSKVTSMKYMFSSITIEDWHYDGTNYQNWTLNETDTDYNGKFPWNQE